MDPINDNHRYDWDGNPGIKALSFENEFVLTLFVEASIHQRRFELATGMRDSGKFDDAVLFLRDSEQVWLFQIKHRTNKGFKISYEDLFPSGMKTGSYSLYKYMQSYLKIRRNEIFKGQDIGLVILSNKSLDDGCEALNKLMNIEHRYVDGFSQRNKSGELYRATKLRPIGNAFSILHTFMNREMYDIKEALVQLFETQKVAGILVQYTTPLKDLVIIGRDSILLNEEVLQGDPSLKWLYNQLHQHYDRIISNKAVKDLFRGESREKTLPRMVEENDIKDFFDRLKICQPLHGLPDIVDTTIYNWLRQFIPPYDLNKFTEAQRIIPRAEFEKVFKNWNESSDKKRNCLSFHAEGSACLTKIKEHLTRLISLHSEPLDDRYIPRYVEDINGLQSNNINIQVSEKELIGIFGSKVNSGCFQLIGNPGIGKTMWMQQIAFEVQKSTDKLVHLIYLGKLSKRDNYDENNVLDFLGSEMDKLRLDTLQETVKNHWRTKKHILIMFDGLDELDESLHKNFITLLHSLSELTHVQVIISRNPRLATHNYSDVVLHSNMKVLNLLPLKCEEKVQFLATRFRLFFKNEQNLQRCAKQILWAISNTMESNFLNFLGHPLMMRIFSDIFLDKYGEAIKSSDYMNEISFYNYKIDPIQLISQFITILFNITMDKRRGQDAYLELKKDTKFLDRFILDHLAVAVEELALCNFKQMFKLTNNRMYLEFADRVRMGTEKSLLINVENDDQIRFIHISFAAYVVAKYLYDNIVHFKSNLLDIFEEQEKVKRFFLLMVEGRFEESASQIDVLESMAKKSDKIIFWTHRAGCGKLARKLLTNFPQRENHFYSSLLFSAVKSGCAELVTYILDLQQIEGNVNSRNEDGRSVLHVATAEGHEEIVEILISRSADITATDHSGQTPLHVAGLSGNLKMVYMLSQHPKSVDVKDNNGQTSLHMVACCGCFQTIKHVVENSAGGISTNNLISMIENSTMTESVQLKMDDYLETAKLLIDCNLSVNHPNNLRHTPLHFAVVGGFLKMTELLIEYADDINVADNNGWTPLHFAAQGGHLEISKLLIAKFGSNDVQIKVNHLNVNDESSLHIAARNGHLKIVELLTENSVTVDTKNKSQQTAFYLAAESGHVEILNHLSKLPNCGNYPDANGKTPTHIAAENGHSDILQILTDMSSDVTVKDSNGQSPLHLAVMNNHLKTVKFLMTKFPRTNDLDIDGHVNIDIPDSSGKTPLHIATANGYVGITQQLIAWPANVEALDSNHDTPLHMAACCGKIETVKSLIISLNAASDNLNDNLKAHIDYAGRSNVTLQDFSEIVHQLLVDRQANVHAQNKSKQTPIHYAVISGSLDMTKKFIDSGADINARDCYGLTPLYYAAYLKHADIVQLLMENSAQLDIETAEGMTPVNILMLNYLWDSTDNSAAEKILDNIPIE